jgi:sec-independent protein translocase protein TatA
MPFGLGAGELIGLLLIVLLLFGAKRIPEIAGSFGKGIKEFKRNMSEAQRAIEDPGTPVRDDRPRFDQAPTGTERLPYGSEPRRDDVPTTEPKRLL